MTIYLDLIDMEKIYIFQNLYSMSDPLQSIYLYKCIYIYNLTSSISSRLKNLKSLPKITSLDGAIIGSLSTWE